MVKSFKNRRDIFKVDICICCCLFGGGEALSLNFAKVVIEFCETTKGAIN